MNTNATQRPREHLGYYEEFLLRRAGQAVKGLGARMLPAELPPDQAGRPLGYAGLRHHVWKEPVELQRGCKVVLVRASRRRPLTVTSMLQKLEGRDL